MAAMRLEGLTKHYGEPPHQVRALAGVDLQIDQGEFVAIVGRSGSGKTTMLDCVGLLMRPSAGRVLLDGVDTGTLNERERAELRSHRIGFIFQEFNLLPTMTAMDNILLPLRYSGGDRKAARARAEASSTRSASLIGPTITRRSSPVASSSGLPSLARLSISRPSCSAMSPWARSTRRPRACFLA